MPIAYPYKMSDWYGYNKDCAPWTLFYRTFAQSKGSLACNKAIEIWSYHTGSGTLPAVNDIVYTSPTSPTTLTSGTYGMRTTSVGSPTNKFVVNSSGVVTSTAAC